MLQAKMIDKFKFVLEDIDIPKPGPNEVLIKIKYAGICGSDRIMLKGESFFYAPIVMGHELSGTVSSKSKNFNIGERVSIFPLVYCRYCEFCKKGDYNLCEKLAFIGDRDFNGGFAEYVTADEDNLFLIPDNINNEESILIEPTAVAYHAVKLTDPEKYKKVMIFGAGIIGLLSLKILKNKFNIKDITVIDIHKNRLDVALKNGASKVVNLNENNWKDKIKYKETLGDNPFQSGEYDAVLDFVSTSMSTNIIISSLKKKGKLISVGLPKGGITITELMFSAISANELCIRGSYCYDKKDFKDAISMISDKVVVVSDLVSAIFSLKDVSRAFKEWEANYNDWFKVLLEP